MQENTDPTNKIIGGKDLKSNSIERQFGIKDPNDLTIEEYIEMREQTGRCIIFPDGKPQLGPTED